MRCNIEVRPDEYCNALLHADPLTETYNFSFYLTYLAKWPEYCQMAEGPGKQAMGYILGKAEGQGELWHGHVSLFALFIIA